MASIPPVQRWQPLELARTSGQWAGLRGRGQKNQLTSDASSAASASVSPSLVSVLRFDKRQTCKNNPGVSRPYITPAGVYLVFQTCFHICCNKSICHMPLIRLRVCSSDFFFFSFFFCWAEAELACLPSSAQLFSITHTPPSRRQPGSPHSPASR